MRGVVGVCLGFQSSPSVGRAACCDVIGVLVRSCVSQHWVRNSVTSDDFAQRGHLRCGETSQFHLKSGWRHTHLQFSLLAKVHTYSHLSRQPQARILAAVGVDEGLTACGRKIEEYEGVEGFWWEYGEGVVMRCVAVGGGRGGNDDGAHCGGNLEH